ncbi:MAG: hypothetical protein AB7S77_17380 [Desulfatirhabdiaceae bacterium]
MSEIPENMDLRREPFAMCQGAAKSRGTLTYLAYMRAIPNSDSCTLYKAPAAILNT